jgi:hypothetical protein
MGLQIFDCSHEILDCLLAVKLSDHFAALVFVFGCSSKRREGVGSKGDKSFHGHPPVDILDMRNQTLFSWMTITPGSFSFPSGIER